MSQMPEMPAAGWAEQGYDPSAYPPQAEAQPTQTAQSAAAWQQDTEPDWGASQQGYPEHDFQAHDVHGQHYQQGQAYQGQGYPGQGQAYAEHQAYAEQQAYPPFPAPAPTPEAESASGLPTEFDHLFRDSTPDSRRAIDRQKPMVGGAGAGYLAASQAAPQALAPEAAGIPDQTAVAPQSGQYQGYQQPFPQQGEQYGEQFPGPAPGAYQGAGFENGQYQATQFQSGGYPQADFQQGAGYGESGGGFGGGSPGGGGGSFGGGGPLGGRLRDRRTLIIGGAVALAAVIGIVIAMSGGSPAPKNSASSGGTPTAVPSKTTPKQQADQIYQLIQQSSQLRSDANTAVVDVNGCKDLANAQSALSSTSQKRQAQADNVAKLDVSGIQNGAQLVSQLKAAWTASAQYDAAYAQIAGDVQNGCKSTNVHKDSNQQAANQAAGAADTAKTQAAQLWNDNVAAPLGESQVSSDKL